MVDILRRLYIYVLTLPRTTCGASLLSRDAAAGRRDIDRRIARGRRSGGTLPRDRAPLFPVAILSGETESGIRSRHVDRNARRPRRSRPPQAPAGVALTDAGDGALNLTLAMVTN